MAWCTYNNAWLTTLSVAVYAEGQRARFVTKTLRVCSGLVLLTDCT